MSQELGGCSTAFTFKLDSGYSVYKNAGIDNTFRLNRSINISKF